MAEFPVSPNNLAKLETLARHIYEHRTGQGVEEPCASDYGIDFLELFLEFQALFAMFQDGEPSLEVEPETIH